MILSPKELELLYLKEVLGKYLTHPSLDGAMIRQELRAELSNLLKTDRLIGNNECRRKLELFLESATPAELREYMDKGKHLVSQLEGLE